MSAFNSQVGGSHYTNCKIQPFQYSMANGLDPMQHTVVKYVTRFRSKNGVEDLKKAIHVLELLIECETYKDKGVVDDTEPPVSTTQKPLVYVGGTHKEARVHARSLGASGFTHLAIGELQYLRGCRDRLIYLKVAELNNTVPDYLDALCTHNEVHAWL